MDDTRNEGLGGRCRAIKPPRKLDYSGRSPLSISFLSQRLSTDKSWNRDVPFAPGSFSKPAPIIGVQRAFAARANRDAATLCHPPWNKVRSGDPPRSAKFHLPFTIFQRGWFLRVIFYTERYKWRCFGEFFSTINRKDWSIDEYFTK